MSKRNVARRIEGVGEQKLVAFLGACFRMA